MKKVHLKERLGLRSFSFPWEDLLPRLTYTFSDLCVIINNSLFTIPALRNVRKKIILPLQIKAKKQKKLRCVGGSEKLGVHNFLSQRAVIQFS